MSDQPTKSPRVTYHLSLTPTARVEDPGRALQALLKAALRLYGLKCTRLSTSGSHDELATLPHSRGRTGR